MPQHLTELSPQHHAAIRMRIEGRPGCEIADELGVGKRTVYLWFGDPLVKAELAHQIQHINELFAERLAGAALEAIDELLGMARQPTQGPISPDTKLKVLRELLAHVPSAPPRDEAFRLFAHLSDDELMAKAKSLASAVGNGSSEIGT